MTASLADAYDAFLFDLDGVLYRGDRAIPWAGEAVASLRSRGKGLAFVTNNSSTTPEAVAARLTAMGIHVVPDEVETSALVTARVLADRGVATAFVIGEEGIRRALVDAGIRVTDGDGSAVDAVVVGWDREADYAKLRSASLLVQDGASLVATNDDAAYPAPDGRLWPGAGAILGVIVTTTGVQPEVIGKPHPPVLESARERAGGGSPLVIGDRLETDIAGAAGLGWDSLLVLTGVTQRADLDGASARPTHVADDLSILLA